MTYSDGYRDGFRDASKISGYIQHGGYYAELDVEDIAALEEKWKIEQPGHPLPHTISFALYGTDKIVGLMVDGSNGSMWPHPLTQELYSGDGLPEDEFWRTLVQKYNPSEKEWAELERIREERLQEERAEEEPQIPAMELAQGSDVVVVLEVGEDWWDVCIIPADGNLDPETASDKEYATLEEWENGTSNWLDLATAKAGEYYAIHGDDRGGMELYTGSEPFDIIDEYDEEGEPTDGFHFGDKIESYGPQDGRAGRY